MSKVIRVNDEMYEILEDVAFKNGVGIQHLADKVLSIGIDKCKTEKVIIVERGREVEIEWYGYKLHGLHEVLYIYIEKNKKIYCFYFYFSI